MTTLLDKHGKPSAIVYNNKIITLKTFEVVGVVLGSCVFGQSGNLMGKLFNKTFYTLPGTILGKEQELLNTQLNEFDPVRVLIDSWKILDKIKDHSTAWVKPTEQWITTPVESFLKQTGSVKFITPQPQLV